MAKDWVGMQLGCVQVVEKLADVANTWRVRYTCCGLEKNATSSALAGYARTLNASCRSCRDKESYLKAERIQRRRVAYAQWRTEGGLARVPRVRGIRCGGHVWPYLSAG